MISPELCSGGVRIALGSGESLHVARVVAGWLRGLLKWATAGFCVSNSFLEGCVEDVRLAEVRKKQAEPAEAGDGDGAIAKQAAEDGFQDEYGFDIFKG